MEVLGEALVFLTDGTNWTGSSGIPSRLSEHVQMTLLATGLAALVALPVGLLIGHTQKGEFLAISVGNLGRALPSFGILAIVFPLTLRYNFPGDIGFAATLITMFLLAIPPILLNTYVGIQTVDAGLLEAVRGQGMGWRHILIDLELPLAAPLIVAGLRNAAVSVVATATLAALVGWGGLGRYLIDGFAVRDMGKILAGAILVAVLAVVTEIAFGFLERATSPKGLKPRRFLPGLEHAGQSSRSSGGPVV